ncbi:hypothetical protein OHU17_24075 [Streptomyces goshikiensis]|uniref:Uncharacterized protein n=1 Tax=Streptomyces goshikiensis TaxID=1942 RepID=A0ABZ1RQN2_9ACTN|nr:MULTISPECIES: hypothetical protein [Streptomyces]ALO08216.1 hypothetical protein AQF52_2621 [Streptomyces venezuelae]QPK45459.1 hypothetical protein H4W23_13000 [Streptomyces gardneri]WRK36791.1 hypothetical protein U0M97_13065 [Streptomyces venezuelae]
MGLDEDQAQRLVQGELDMGVSHCKDPWDSPFSPRGELCAVAPLRCLECRNAWVLPSQLPQLMLFAEHLERVRRRLDPVTFTRQWGQSYVNLQAALDERTDQEKALAQQHIDAGTGPSGPAAVRARGVRRVIIPNTGGHTHSLFRQDTDQPGRLPIAGRKRPVRAAYCTYAGPWTRRR